MSIRLTLARLAGARGDLLTKAPGDLVKQASMGGVLLSTAIVAGVSAFFALHAALGLSWQVCAPAAIAWSLIVLNIDRMLVVSMSGLTGFWHRVFVAVPRVVLALVIGSVISTPLVLQIFRPEIEAELTIMKAEAIARSKEALANTYRQIEELRAERDRLQATIAGNATASVSEDADVKAAAARVEAAERAFRELDAAAQCELDGTCGTRVPGTGKAYDEKRAVADTARSALESARDELERTTERVRTRLQNAAVSDADAARGRLPVVEQDLKTEEERRRAAETVATEAQNENSGLLARLEALERITDGHSSAALAHLMLFLLFASIEILPVLTKILSSVGPKPLYERLAERADDDTEEAERLASDTRHQIVKAAEDARLTIARDQTDAQVEAGRRATQLLVDKQTRIALRAIHVWGDLAMARADDELDSWYRQHIGPLHGNGRPSNGQHVNGASFGPTGAAPMSASELTMPIPSLPGT